MPSLPETRASLIQRLPDAADARAWEEFVAVYGPLVYRLARRQGLQPADADDVVQQALAAVARAVEQWLARADRGKFRGWLLRIAKNLAINTLTRKKLRSLGTLQTDVVHPLARRGGNGEPMGSDFDLEYRRELFRWAAQQVRDIVSEKTWQAFWLSTIEDQPIAAVAQQLEISVGNVYVARSRVMARLREVVRGVE